MPNCAILSCKNSTKNVGRNNGNVSFHRFPNDPSIKEKWIDATGQKNWFPTKFTTICSIHFNDGSFAETNKNRRLNTYLLSTYQYIIKYTVIHRIITPRMIVPYEADGQKMRQEQNLCIRQQQNLCLRSTKRTQVK
ncbi:hypothetical protein ABMA27_000076 [Loxostege sticticalis]|uniref:THAP-type domain-containing protein n=1 Tax=Loxostege sticticalis TaxID=481309 RepID=A0ABR3IM20_LOXSC